MGKKRFIEKLKDDDYGEQIREYSIKGIGKCYGEYFKNKAKLKTPTIETLAESVKELQQRIYVAEKKIAEMENHLFPEPADFRLDAVKDSINGYIEDKKEMPDSVIQEYNRLVLPAKTKPVRFEYGYCYFFSYELYEKSEGFIHSEKYKAIDNVQVEATSPYNNIGVIGNFTIRPEWCVKKENLLELKADVDKAIKLLNKIKERIGEDEI